MRRGKYHWYLILLLLIVFLVLEIYLPIMAENKLKQILVDETDSIDQIDVQVSSFPAVEILLGRIDQVIVEAKGLKFKGLYLDIFNVQYHQVRFTKDSFTGNNTDLDILISETALNEYLTANYPELEDFKIRLIPDQVYLSGVLKIFDAKLKIELSGTLAITGNNKVVFTPENFQLEDFKIAASLIRDFIQDKGFSFDLKELDIPLNVKQVIVNQGELRLVGKV